MRYDEARGTVQDGDILLFAGRHWLSRLIKRFTGRYSHSAIACWWDDRLMVLEATWPGQVRAVPASFCVDDYNGPVDLWTCTYAGLDRAKVVSAAKALLGRKYSFRKVVAALRRFLAPWRRTSPPADPTDAPKQLQCSEYVSYCLRQGGLDVAPGLPDAMTDPADFEHNEHMTKVARIHA